MRLADTNLFIRIERDDSLPGSELLTGFGRPVRDGMLIGRQPGPSKLDLLVTNVVVLDPVLGVIKTNIGIKDGRIVGVGRAGNPDVTDNIDLVLSASTGIINGDGLIATAGRSRFARSSLIDQPDRRRADVGADDAGRAGLGRRLGSGRQPGG